MATPHIRRASEIDADIVALHHEGGVASIQVFFFRGGRNCGNRPYFPRHDRADEPGEILAAFAQNAQPRRLLRKIVLDKSENKSNNRNVE